MSYGYRLYFNRKSGKFLPYVSAFLTVCFSDFVRSEIYFLPISIFFFLGMLFFPLFEERIRWLLETEKSAGTPVWQPEDRMAFIKSIGGNEIARFAFIRLKLRFLRIFSLSFFSSPPFTADSHPIGISN